MLVLVHDTNKYFIILCHYYDVLNLLLLFTPNVCIVTVVQCNHVTCFSWNELHFLIAAKCVNIYLATIAVFLQVEQSCSIGD